MVGVPSVFNRNDFVAILLPGYINVIVTIAIFRPGLLTFKDLSFDLFSTVLLVIAGPSLGIVLRQFYRTFSNLWGHLKSAKRRSDPSGKRMPPPEASPALPRDSWASEYARLRLKSTPEELLELDTAEADMDFNASTALGLGFQAIATVALSIQAGVTIALLLVAFVFTVGAYVEWLDSFGPMYNEIRSRHA